MLAKSKLNSIETLISQALIDFEISHEKYKSIINEYENYRRMKENIKMIKSSDKLSENNKNIRENGENVCRIKKYIYIFKIYKMFKFRAKTFAKNCVYNRIDK